MGGVYVFEWAEMGGKAWFNNMGLSVVVVKNLFVFAAKISCYQLINHLCLSFDVGGWNFIER
ncbi:MAG: hypothetical protein COB24_12430 [Hyphomicrobiales bacterium]|nr:MAG: hypothetical protein COB24_12430 [Hyphomicrobiales bacterium]